ncbi:MAG TPA: rod shape-determining protein MreD, partial [Candidatus Bathyarchaeia archaeon]|nr:rod shape-determining protein MreD [Candidatus Bathyarchaeia archaeon]
MNIFLLVLIIFSFYNQDFKKIFWLAFLSGVLIDLVLGDKVGFSSLIFLSICFLVFLYRDKFSSSHLLFQLAFVILANCFLDLII